MAPHDPIATALASSRILSDFSERDRVSFARRLAIQEFAPGAEILHEGDIGRVMYFVLEGQARLTRRHVQLASLGPGDIFGELALITERPRAGTVVAATALRVARLSLDDYLRLKAEEPVLAAKLLEALIGVLGTELVSITENVRMLLAERSSPRRSHVTVRVGAQEHVVPVGTQLMTLLPATHDGLPVIAALVDRKAVGVGTRLVADSHVEPLTLTHPEGREIFARSAGLLALEAIHDVEPSLLVRVGPLEGARREFEVEGGLDVIPPLDYLNRRLQELISEDRPYHQEQWGIDEAQTMFQERGWESAAAQLRIWRNATVSLASCGEIQALSPGPTVHATGALVGIRLVMEGDTLVLDLGEPFRLKVGAHPIGSQPRPPPPDAAGGMVGEHRRWIRSLDAASVGQFNDRCIDGDVGELIRVAEGFHEKRIGRLADLISEKVPAVRVICIAGPSSSGKTTFIKRLTVQMQVNGLDPVALSLDDYYIDRVRTPKDESGEYDFEAFEAIDVALLQTHLGRLMKGEKVKTARYDFRTGLSIPAGGREVALHPNSVIMLEGIHGLNPNLIGPIATDDSVFRIFIHPATTLRVDRLSTLSPTDLRLLRRLVRDRHQRGYDAAETIARWPAVLRGEQKHILPFRSHATSVFDSALIYELSVLKVYAERYLLEVPASHPSFTTAFRLRHLLDRFVTIYPDHVPPTSILREFVGGSGFEY